MKIETLSHDGCRAHLIVSERTQEAALVDPSLSRIDADLALLKSHGLALRWVIDTHTHADHLSSASLLAKKTGAGYAMHDTTRVKPVTRRVADGEELGMGDIAMRFIHVPGHTRDSLIVALPGTLLTGDFLFLGSDAAGRLDLPGADAESHHRSLRKLDAFEDAVEIRPAHDYKGLFASSLGRERAANPVLSPRTRDEYLDWWSRRRSGPADWMGRVVAANAEGATDPDTVPIPKDGSACAAACAAGPSTPAVPEWSVEELAKRLKSPAGLVILDVREPDEYIGELGHIDGSCLIPLGNLESQFDEIPPGPVVTVCRSGQRSARAAAALHRAGLPVRHGL